MQFIQVRKCETSRELRDTIIKALEEDSHKLFFLTLYKEGEGENKYSEPESFVIQHNTCEIMETVGALSLAFEKGKFLRQCLGQNKWNSLKGEVSAVRDSLNKIEDVLGKVPEAKKLKDSVNKLIQSFQDCFKYG